jgi:hypothetical protein
LTKSLEQQVTNHNDSEAILSKKKKKKKKKFSKKKDTVESASCMIQKYPTTNEGLEQGIMLKWKPYRLLKMRFRSKPKIQRCPNAAILRACKCPFLFCACDLFPT